MNLLSYKLPKLKPKQWVARAILALLATGLIGLVGYLMYTYPVAREGLGRILGITALFLTVSWAATNM